jgi:hypothetical protein
MAGLSTAPQLITTVELRVPVELGGTEEVEP